MELIVSIVVLAAVVIVVAVCNARVCRGANDRADRAERFAAEHQQLLRDFADRALSACDLSLDAKRVERERQPYEQPKEPANAIPRHNGHMPDALYPTRETPAAYAPDQNS